MFAKNWRDIFSRFCMAIFPLKPEGLRIPWWAGPAWVVYESRRVRLAPLGLHLVLRGLRRVWYFLTFVAFPDYGYRERQRWIEWERQFWQRRLSDEQIAHGVTKQELLNAESRGYAHGWNDHVNKMREEFNKMREELKRHVD